MVADTELNIIKCNPIKLGLPTFCRRFKLTCSKLGLSFSHEEVPVVFSTVTTLVAHSLVRSLIQDLQSEPVTSILPSRIADGSLVEDLDTLFTRAELNQLDTSLAIPLVERIAKNELNEQTWNDVEIWNAVFKLVEQTNTSAPPTASGKFTTPSPTSANRVPTNPAPTTLDTPFRPSSASQQGAEQTHFEVDQRILEELTGRVYYNVGGFYERHFKDKPWTKLAGDIYERSKIEYVQDHWRSWPTPPSEKLFYEWFSNLQKTVFGGLSRRYYIPGNKVLSGSGSERKLDIFLGPSDAVLLDGQHDWSDVLVIGEHKQNFKEDDAGTTLVQLAGYAREVFGSQPTRRFVPGFTICGSQMRLWLFDRSGAYSSEMFDINEQPERFLTVMTGYVLMTDAELGLNTFILWDGCNKYVLAQGEKIFLEDKPIASQKAIVCRGTTCYRGKRSNSDEWKYVVKFAWPPAKRQREGDLFKVAKERGVTGIAEWFDHQQINIDGNPDTIANMRRSIIFGKPKKITSKALWIDSIAELSQSSRARSLGGRSRKSTGCSTNLGISNSSTTISSSEKKRKSDGEVSHQNNILKRSKLSNDQMHMPNTPTNSGRSQPATTRVQGDKETEIDSLGDDTEAYDNRIHCCLVTSPAGRPLSAYKSIKELLEALCDAIAGHKSLLVDGQILHRDVSENNIIITESSTGKDPKGRLIDLDLAKELDSSASGASCRTGTMQFMAIEVLQGKRHTYRHDLESFFYVLIWICIRYGHGVVRKVKDAAGPDAWDIKRKVKPPSTSILRKWYTGTYSDIADAKSIHMIHFGRITAEFAPEFHGLRSFAEELRDILFPDRGRRGLYVGTPRDHNLMYDAMINVFDKAIAHLGHEE